MIQTTYSKALFWFSISFILGITIESILPIPQLVLYGFLLFGFSLVIIPKRFIIILGLCLIFLTLGVLRVQMANSAIQNDPLRQLNDTSEKVTLTGKIIDASDVREKIQRLKVNIQDTKSILLVTADRRAKYHYLDTIQLTGQVKTPANFEDFNYQNYLLKDGIYSVMDFPNITLVSQKKAYSPVSLLYANMLIFKEKVEYSIQSNFPGSYGTLLEGILLGTNKNMDQDLKDKLNANGVRHLTAVSGSHIIVFSSVIMSLLLLCGFFRPQAFYISITIIWLYIIFIGFPASAIRAGIMGSILLLAEKVGRQNSSSRTIILSAALMLLQNPLLLFYDVGFQLSFLASAGIIHIKPIIDRLIQTKTDLLIWVKKEKIKDILIRCFHELKSIFSATLAAQIFTIPIMMYNFGNISLVAPITNILVIPAVTLLMQIGFLAAGFGIISHFLGWVFALPCYLLLFYFLKVMDIFYQPWAIITVSTVPLVWFFVYYNILFIVIDWLNKKLKPMFMQ